MAKYDELQLEDSVGAPESYRYGTVISGPEVEAKKSLMAAG